MKRTFIVAVGLIGVVILVGAAISLASTGAGDDEPAGRAPDTAPGAGASPPTTPAPPVVTDPAPASTPVSGSSGSQPPLTPQSPPLAATQTPAASNPGGSVSSPPQPPPNLRGTQPSPPSIPPLAPPSSLPPGTVLEPAPIDGLEVVIRESFPPQYTLQVKAGLPSGCARPAGQEVARSGNVIRVRVLNTNTPAAICTAIYGMYDVNINLGSDFIAGQQYRIEVNDEVTSFTAQ